MIEPGGQAGESTRTQRLRRFLAARFDTKSQLGLGLTTGFVGFALAIWALAGLLDAVLDNAWLVRMDGLVEDWFHAHASSTGLRIFDGITQLGSPVVVAIVVVITLYLWRANSRLLLWTWLGVNIGGAGVEYVLKSTVHRSRPQYGAAYLHGHSYSFPSGHTMGSTVCYLLLAHLIASRSGTSPRSRRLTFAIAGLLVAAIGLSRLYLGVHYPSDVLGGFAAGVAWLSACGVVRRFVAGRHDVRAA
jgi:membrane-associated phospholipid phosphatase